MRRMIFRPVLEPPPALPLAARSVGEERTTGGLVDRQPARELSQIIWTVSGAGVVTRPEHGGIAVGTGEVAWIRAGEPIDLVSSGPWHYWWWTVDGACAEAMLDALGWPASGHRHAGACPVAVFERLIVEIRRSGGHLVAAATAYQLLMAASASTPSARDDLVDRCAALIASHGADATCDVHWLANQLHCHRATLSRRCAAAWGHGPGDALRAWRRQRGLELLMTSDDPIASVAHQAGFADPAYFSREIRRATGHAPRALRANR